MDPNARSDAIRETMLTYREQLDRVPLKAGSPVPPPGMGFIYSGLLLVKASLAHSRVATGDRCVLVKGRGHFFGVESFFTSSSYRLEALVDSEVILFDWDWLMNEMPRDLMRAALSYYATAEVNSQVRHLVHYESLTTRTVQALARLRDAAGDIELPLTLEQISEIVGSTRPRMSRILKTLEEHDLVERSYRNYLIADAVTLYRTLRDIEPLEPNPLSEPENEG